MGCTPAQLIRGCTGSSACLQHLTYEPLRMHPVLLWRQHLYRRVEYTPASICVLERHSAPARCILHGADASQSASHWPHLELPHSLEG